MNRTKIEWVKNPDGTQGYTWNPITGCLNGCEYCYARKLANGRLRERYLANRNTIPSDPLKNFASKEFDPKYIDPFYPRFWPERLLDIPFTEKPLGIFPCDMSDLFGIGIPEFWTEKVFVTINMYPEHRFYLLTKQPQNLIKWSPFPDTCWVGVTVCADGDATNAYYGLSHIEAVKRFASFEPLLGAITMKSHRLLDVVDGVIIGAQTKPYKPPKIEWLQEIVEAADKAGIPVFLKDNLRPLLAKLTINDKWAWANNIGRGGVFRQEMPTK